MKTQLEKHESRFNMLKYIGKPEYFDGIFFYPDSKYNAFLDKFHADTFDVHPKYVVKVWKNAWVGYIRIPYNCNPIGRYWEYC